MANQPTPPPGASAEGVGQGQCSRALFSSAVRPRKKIVTKLNIYFYFFTPYPTYNTPKMMASHLPHASHLLHIPSMLPSITATCFWLVVVFWTTNWRPINPTLYFIFIIFALLHSTSQTIGQCFPTRSTPRVPDLSRFPSTNTADTRLVVVFSFYVSAI